MSQFGDYDVLNTFEYYEHSFFFVNVFPFHVVKYVFLD